MSFLPPVIAILLGLSALLIVVYPLLGLEREADASTLPLRDAAAREQAAKQALRDVDFDYRLGNLDSGDYASLRDRYEQSALAAIKTRYEREQELDALIEQQLAALRAQDARHGAGRSQAAAGASPTRVAPPRPAPARGPQARRRRGGGA